MHSSTYSNDVRGSQEAAACMGGRGDASHRREQPALLKTECWRDDHLHLASNCSYLCLLLYLRRASFLQSEGQNCAPVSGSLGAKYPMGAGIPPQFLVLAEPILRQHLCTIYALAPSRVNTCFPLGILNNYRGSTTLPAALRAMCL